MYYSLYALFHSFVFSILLGNADEFLRGFSLSSVRCLQCRLLCGEAVSHCWNYWSLNTENDVPWKKINEIPARRLISYKCRTALGRPFNESLNRLLLCLIDNESESLISHLCIS